MTIAPSQSSAPRGLRLIADRRVATKIALAVVTVAIMGAAVGVLSIVKLGTVAGEADDVHKTGLQFAALASVRNATNQFRIQSMTHMLTTENSVMDAAEQVMDEQAEVVTTKLTEFRSYGMTAEQRESADKFEAAFEEYHVAIRDVLIPASRTNNLTLIRQVNAEKVEPLVEAARIEVDTLAKLTLEHSVELKEEADATYRSTRTLVLALLIVAMLIGVSAAFWISRMIVAPLARCVEALRQIGSGDLTARADVRGKDEVGQLADTLNNTAESVAGLVRQVSGNADHLASASEELSAVASQLSMSAEEASAQAGTVSSAATQVSSSVQTVAAGAEEMGASIREIAANAGEAARVSATAADAAQRTNATVTKLGESSAQIGSVVSLITSIAEQTNLLALNATIEAARAGDAGKGFAVVASEVKDLAQETAKATEDIATRVAAIQAETQGAVAAIAEIAEVINKINDYTSTIASAVEEQTATTSEMARSVGEAAGGSSNIAENISGVAEAAGAVTGGATETQQTATELARVAAELRQTVSAYRV